jgi:hypothetical protein
MNTSLTKRNTHTLVIGDSLTLEPSLIDAAFSEDVRDERDARVEPVSLPAWGTEPLSDKVIGLREWGTGEIFTLRAPQHARELASTDTAALQLARGGAIAAANRIEIVYEGQTWRVKDRTGLSTLKQEGRPTREVSLLPGTEVTIAGRTFLAESPRCIALRNFCARLLGWNDSRIAAVDHALRAIRLASTGRTQLTLTGSGDLVPLAYAIHRYSVGDRVPFIVSDPRRRDTVATVRSPANYASAVAALRNAAGGTLCVRARRLPPDFGEILHAFREPEHPTQLMICDRGTRLPNATQIDIPLLESRRSDVPRIVSEYVEDAMHALRAPEECLESQDVEWILEHASFGGELTLAGIEKATLRAVALKMTGDLTLAARRLGMARISLERWVGRRERDTGVEP